MKEKVIIDEKFEPTKEELLRQGYRVERINTDRNDKEHRVLFTNQGGGKTRTLLPKNDQ